MSTTEQQPIDVETVNTQAVAVRQTQEIAPAGLFGTDEPVAIIAKASMVASALKDVIRQQGLISKISGKEYPRCEAWTLLGTMLGVFPVLVWTKQLEDGWEARVEARTKDGSVVGAAEAQCLRGERNWEDRDDFALRSMAQTRATAKCLRMPLGFVMTLAGYEATPAEEMVTQHSQSRENVPQSRQSSPGRAGGVSSATPPAQNSRATPPANAPRANQGSTAPAKAPPAPLKLATDQTRAWMIRGLNDCIDLATEYFRKLANPAVLLPNETLEQLPLEFVPISTAQLRQLQAAIGDFGNGHEAVHAYPANPIPEEEKKKRAAKAKPAQAEAPAKAPPPHVQTAKRDPEWWRDIIVPIPPKGVKRDEYMRAPNTIGQLYEDRHNEETARRLFGFIGHFEPKKTWVDGQGQERQRSEQQIEADELFREALDACKEYADKHHEDGTGDPPPLSRESLARAAVDDDVPF